QSEAPRSVQVRGSPPRRSRGPDSARAAPGAAGAVDALCLDQPRRQPRTQLARHVGGRRRPLVRASPSDRPECHARGILDRSAVRRDGNRVLPRLQRDGQGDRHVRTRRLRMGADRRPQDSERGDGGVRGVRSQGLASGLSQPGFRRSHRARHPVGRADPGRIHRRAHPGGGGRGPLLRSPCRELHHPRADRAPRQAGPAVARLRGTAERRSMRTPGRSRRAIVVVALVTGFAASSLPARAADPDSASKPRPPKEREVSYYYDLWDHSMIRPATRMLDVARIGRLVTRRPREAFNVDPNDQVRLPSTWWTPRLGFRTVTVEQMLAGPGGGKGPAPGRWTLKSAKTQGVTPGFNIKDSAGDRFVIKFDPPGNPELGSGADV